jgi:hypothetical protein
MNNNIQNLYRETVRKRLFWTLEDNVKIDLKEIGCEVMDSIILTQDKVQWRAVVNTVRDLRMCHMKIDLKET